MSENPPDSDRTVVVPQDQQRTTRITMTPMVEDIPAPPPPPPAPMGGGDSGNALPIGTYLDEFELRSVAGEGGFSIVYRAWDHSLNRQVAVKEYMPAGLAARGNGNQVSVRSERHRETFEAGLRSFVEEARLLAHFDHPALIKVYRFWKANGSAYMVMPFCEGITLRDQWRASPEPPDENSLLTLLDPLTEALAVLHAEHWYHRDVAPDNVIMITGTGRPLLLDFGAARQVIGDMTHALTVILKPGYAPIEQWGEVPGMKQGPWTDVYALAAMLHFAIVRKTPPPSVGRLVNDNYEPLESVAAGRYSPRFLAAIDRALVVRPEARTPSIDQFRAEIGLGPTAMTQNVTFQLPMAGENLLPTQRISDSMAPTMRVTPTQAAFDRTTPPFGASAAAPVADIAAERTVQSPPAASGKPVGLMIGGVLALGVVAVGAYMVLGRSPDKPAPAPPPGLSATAPTPPPAAPLAVVAPPAAPPAVAPFDPVSEFSKVAQSQTAGFVVEATLKRSTLRAEKDDLQLSLRSDRDGFVYVFNFGSDGELLQLYPHGDVKPRVRKGVPLELGRDEKLTVTGPAGPSQVLVMVSALPREHPNFPPAKVDGGYRYYPTGPAAAALVAKHTGPLPAIAGSAVCPAGGNTCADDFGAAVVTFNVVK